MQGGFRIWNSEWRVGWCFEKTKPIQGLALIAVEWFWGKLCRGGVFSGDLPAELLDDQEIKNLTSSSVVWYNTQFWRRGRKGFADLHARKYWEEMLDGYRHKGRQVGRGAV